jgi:hypothetical protein
VSGLLNERQAAYEAALSKLKGKQRAFVEAYLRTLHGTKAAIEAEYSKETARSQASRMLTNVNIRAAIDAGFALRAMPADEVLLRLSEQAASSLEDFLDVREGVEPINDDDDADEDNAPLRSRRWGLDLDKAAKAGKLHLVKKLKATKFRTEIELYDAQAALQLLGRHHKLFDADNILKFLDLSKLSDAQLTRINQGEDPIAVLLDKQPDPA